MNRLKTLTLLVALIVPLSLTVGCASRSAERVAVSANASLFASIESLEDAWGDYVVAGHAKQEQIDRVAIVHERYRSARRVAIVAVTHAKDVGEDPASSGVVARAMAAYSDAAADLNILIQSIIR